MIPSATRQRATLSRGFRRRLGLGLLVGLWTLGCSGWLSTETDMIGVDRELAVDQGYVVPLQAQKVFIRDRKATRENVRTTWFRYRLPPQALDDLRKELAGDEDVEPLEQWVVPDNWPDFASFGFETPSWWNPPAGQAFRQELTVADAVAIPSGRIWSIDDDEDEVYVWLWEWEGWSFEARDGLDPTPAAPRPRQGNDAVVEEAAAGN
ncbi:MAG: hypothetical protein AAGA48_22625 [Myxococcota bacterium]